jgi:hypothetical protein
MSAIDWTKIVNKYKGLWVALERDEITVIASGKTAKDAWNKAQNKGFKKPILARMPLHNLPFIGSL